MKKRVLVVGLGSIGRRHARLLAERGDLVVEWCDVSRKMLELAVAELGNPARVFNDFPEAIASVPDYVVIATPQTLHCEQALAALDAGIPVLCEKPLSDSLSDARRIVERVRSTGGVLAVGFQSHFSDGHLRLRELVRTGVLGQIRHFHCRVGTYITLQNSTSRYQSGMLGALIQDYSHQPDLAHWILETLPSTVHAHAITSRVPHYWAEPNILTVTSTYDEMLGTLHLNYIQMPQRHHYEVVGDEGWVFFDVDTSTLEIGNRSSNSVAVETHPVERDDLYRREHVAFLAAAAGKRDPESSAADALVSVAFADAAIASWQSGEASSFPSLTGEPPARSGNSLVSA